MNSPDITNSAPTADAFLSVNNIEVIYDHVILVLKAISTLLRNERGDVTKGEIKFKGQRVDHLTPNELVKRGLSQVMEGRHCFSHLSIEENLLTGAYTRSISASELRQDLEQVYHFFPRLKERRN